MKKYRQLVLIVILLIAFIAYQDINGLAMWKSLGDFSAEAYVKAEPSYMKLFWIFALTLGGLVAIVYYILRKDKSEALALFAIFGILLWSGWEDILYFIFQGIPISETLPWLEGNMYISTVRRILGQEAITPFVLWVSAISGAFVSYYTAKWLKKQ